MRLCVSGTPWSVDSDTISTHDDNDRLTSAGVTTCTWDARGRLTGETDGLETLVHSWSGDDRLLSVTGGAAEVNYSYDGEQRLIGRQEGAEPAVSFIVDSGFEHAQALVEYTGTLGAGATIDARHVFGQRLLGERRAELQWAVTDALGSVRGLYDADAGTPLTGPWGYEAYGPHLSGAPPAALTHRFAGERRDAATGLDYLRARWMRPGWGAFTARDPWEGTVKRSYTRLPYVYANLSPAELSDPSGESSLSTLLASVATIGLVVPLLGDSPGEIDNSGAPVPGIRIWKDEFRKGEVGETAAWGHEWIEFPGGSIGYWPSRKHAPPSGLFDSVPGEVRSPDSRGEAGVPRGAATVTSVTWSPHAGVGRTCVEAIDCLQRFAAQYDEDYCLATSNCTDFVERALAECDLVRKDR